MTNERWLKWAIARYYRSHGHKVSMKPARAGNAMVDGVAISPDGERIAIEVKSPRDDLVRGVTKLGCPVACTSWQDCMQSKCDYSSSHCCCRVMRIPISVNHNNLGRHIVAFLHVYQ